MREGEAVTPVIEGEGGEEKGRGGFSRDEVCEGECVSEGTCVG